MYALLLTLLFGSAGTEARVVETAHSSASLLCDHAAVSPGAVFKTGLLIRPEPGWHVYWFNPGDSGAPPILKWRVPDGVAVGDLQWPAPTRIPAGPLLNYGYEDEVLLAVPMTAPAGAPGGRLTLRLDAEWLVCKEECVPAFASFTLELPVQKAAQPGTRWNALFERARKRLPVPERGVSLETVGDQLSLRAEKFEPREFLPYDPLVIENAARQELRDGALSLLRAQQADSWPERLRGILTDAEGGAHEIDIPIARQTAAPLPLAAALLLAFIGGLLLNCMPCVFPILSIKALGLLQGGGARQAWFYSTGVVASFLALGGGMLVLRAGGARIGWGFQLQAPLFSGLLAVLFVFLGLNLLGLFEFGTSLTRLGGAARGDDAADAFLSGILAVIIATPCTAPFMGTALGAALAMPAASALAVFLALGIGMALPFAALTARPEWGRLLPKPGRWMETLRQGLAFPLFLTAAWLAWVVGLQTGAPWLGKLAAALAGSGFAFWLWKRFENSFLARNLACVAALATMAVVFKPAPEDPVVWTAWTPERVEQARAAGRTVFVDFTAAWCVTCQVNERTALSSSEFKDAAAQTQALLLKADWTQRDPAITRALEALGRSGVPVYVIYSPDDPDGKILPSVLTPSLASDALRLHARVLETAL